MTLVVDEALHPQRNQYRQATLPWLRTDRPPAGVIAGGSKPGHVAREFLRGANAIEPCALRQLHEAAHSWEPAERMPNDRQRQRRATGLR